MREVFCNTSPLQYLHQLGLLPVLRTLAERIVVPLLAQLQSLGFWLDPRTHAAVLRLASEG